MSLVISRTTASALHAEKAAEKAKDVKGKCVLATSFLTYKKLVANGFKNNHLLFTHYPIIGRQGKIQTSGSCLYSSPSNKATACSWDPRIDGLSFFESTAIFPASNFSGFIRNVKKLHDINPDNFCGADLYNGFLVRFIGKSDAYLGQSEESVVVDFNYFRADEASMPRLNGDVWEEVEQLAFVKYSARPHWGKNRNVCFVDVQNKYPRFGSFVAAMKELDPEKVFWSEWSDEVVFGKVGDGVKEDGCGLEGMCVCSEDKHCSPGNGYFCRRGLVYDQARVCRYASASSSMVN